MTATAARGVVYHFANSDHGVLHGGADFAYVLTHVADVIASPVSAGGIGKTMNERNRGHSDQPTQGEKIEAKANTDVENQKGHNTRYTKRN